MYQSITDIVFAILRIIDYPNDKTAFVAEFEKLTQEETLLNVLKKLPTDVQEKIRASVNNEEAITYVPKDMYLPEFVKTSHQSLAHFIEAISSTLSLDQKEKIRALVS